MKTLIEYTKADIYFKKIISIIAIVLILSVIGITATHHHDLNEHDDEDCVICFFINIVKSAILPKILVLLIIAIFINIILIFNKNISSENGKAYFSRAPPVIR